MAILQQSLLRKYETHLSELRRELERWPRDSAEAAHLRDFIRHYEERMRDLEGVT